VGGAVVSGGGREAERRQGHGEKGS